jgi:uncharacterized protein YjbI with pentapeptide repeats
MNQNQQHGARTGQHTETRQQAELPGGPPPMRNSANSPQTTRPTGPAITTGGIEMIEILNRWTQAVLYTSDTANTPGAAAIEALGKEADLRGANLREADLRGADLCGADLCGADLRGADLCGADLRGADLCGADLCGANLCGADLCGANLRGADLCGADLCGANLRGADLCGANLRGADLCGANLREADLCGANLCGAKQCVLRIQGSRHEITCVDDDVRIGCHRRTLAQWLTIYAKIGAEENYSAEQIAEYWAHLKHIEALLAMRMAAKEAK